MYEGYNNVLNGVSAGPENPKVKLDVFLQPLISELKHLWDVGVYAYDISLKTKFPTEGGFNVDHQ